MVERTERSTRTTVRKLLSSKWFLWASGLLAIIALVLFSATFFLDEPLRRLTEQKINRDLKGYSVRLPELRTGLIGLSITLKGLTVVQLAHPEHPVAYFPRLKARVRWREFIRGKHVAEFVLDEPKLNINLQQLREEAANKAPLKQRGWQQAVEDIYPMKINSLKIREASITYIDQDPQRPLVLSHLNLEASNIRNIESPDKVYPSSFHLDTVIFGSGHGTIDGKANFLAEPLPGFKAEMKLEKVSMDYFKTVLARSNLSISGGVFGAEGEVEYAPKVRVTHLKEMTIQGMKVDYRHSDKTAGAEKKRAVAAGKEVKKLSNQPDVQLTVDQLHLTGCTLGIANDAGGKRYRIFIADTDFGLSNFSNQASQGPAKLRLSGRFMGSGVTNGTGLFRPGKKGPDLDLYLKIDDAQLTSMNEVMRAFGNFDVAAGTFTVVTELHIKNQAISGYIKPFFKDVKVYDREKDKNKGAFHQMRELLIGGAAKILKNRPREQVATKVDISGSLAKPHTSTLQIVEELLRNAFVKAILPNFEKEFAGSGKR
jgi:hypothetical protein